MADATGPDLLLQLLDGQKRLEGQMERLTSIVTKGFETVNSRVDHSNDTLTLLGSVIHNLAAAMKPRMEEVERRISALEEEAR